jgi:NADH-quinone oxidoreductase subunit N
MTPGDLTTGFFSGPLFSALGSLGPILLLFCGAGLGMVLIRLVADSNRAQISRLWTITILLLSAWLELHTQFSSDFMASMMHDPFSRFFRLVAVGGFTLLAIFLPPAPETTLVSRSHRRVLELTYPLILLSVGGIFFLSAAYDLLTLFIGIELCAIPLYLYYRGIVEISESEAQVDTTGDATDDSEQLRARFLRVFGFGLFSSLILLFGLAVLYGIGGETNLLQLRINISIVFLTYKKLGPGLILAIALISAGLASKLGLAPFHMWLGEFHASRRCGALPLAILTGLLSGTIAIARIFDNTLIAFSGDVMAPLDWAPALTTIFSVSMLLTVVVILREQSARRLLLWISLAQGGFALVGIMSASAAGLSGALGQIMFTVLALAIVIPLVERLAPEGARNQPTNGQISETRLSEITGLAYRSPLTAGTLILTLASIGALPFTGGFVARMGLIESALESQQWWAFTLIVVVSLAILYSVVRIILSMFRKPERDTEISAPHLNMSMRLAAVLTCAIIVYTGIEPAAIQEITAQAASVFGL